LEAKHVQTWIDALINPTGETGTSAKTVKRKLGEMRNYWRYLQSHQVVAEDRDPFARRRIKDPANRRTTRDEERTGWSKAEVVMLWTKAEARKDAPLAHAIRLAAYTGARIEGVAKLRISDIRTDPETQIRFMRMADKNTARGSRRSHSSRDRNSD
jgi:site-specific recombinase XerD